MTDRPSAVMVLGILGRSGTNHLHDLLQMHPELAPVPGLWEDNLVRHLPRLDAARSDISSRWRHQPIGEVGADALAVALGGGVLAFLQERTPPGTIPLVKTPAPNGIGLLARFLPSVRAVVVVRDARDVAESCVKTFGSTKQRWLRVWRAGAREIVDALDVTDVARRVHLVRYEDLVADRRSALGQVFDFLSLPPLTVSADELDCTPVRGSSDLGGRGTIHWKPVAMGDDFSPVERYRQWSSAELREADLLLGPELEAFGYDRTSPGSLVDPASRFALHARHVLVSGTESARVRIQRAKRRIVQRS